MFKKALPPMTLPLTTGLMSTPSASAADERRPREDVRCQRDGGGAREECGRGERAEEEDADLDARLAERKRLFPADVGAVEDDPRLQQQKGEAERGREYGRAAPIPVWPATPGVDRKRAGERRRQQITDEQRVDDKATFDRISAEERVCENEQAEGRAGEPERSRGERGPAEYDIGARCIEPRQDEGKAEGGDAHQPLFDEAGGGRVGVAAVHRMADFEEHQKGREQHGERVGRAGRNVIGLPAQQSTGIGEGRGGNAVAEQQPVEDRRRRKRRTDDAGLVGEASSNDKAERRDTPAQRRESEAVGDEGRGERRQGERHRKSAAVERENESARQGRNGASGKGAEADTYGRRRPMRKTVPEQARGGDERSADERRGERHRARSGTMREAHIGDGDGAEGRQGSGAGVDRGDQRSQLVASAGATRREQRRREVFAPRIERLD